jgi:hypothetical protein
MKKQTMTAVAFCVIGVAVAAFGAPGDGIIGGPHDLRSLAGNNTTDAGTGGRVCAYCHTPHHAVSGTSYLPLWARTIDTQTFTTPYVSTTIDAAELKESTSDKAIGPTRLCMSCHDGSIAADQHYGQSGATVLTGDVFSTTPGSGAGVGASPGGLSNDHPVGFSYSDVAAGPSSGNPDAAAITAAATAGGKDPWIRVAGAAGASYLNNTYLLKVQDRLFTSGGKNYMTCATCHDVHNKKNLYTGSGSETVNYFTLAAQANSDLCLSCHIK